jgi:hypothetical protein
MTGTHRLADGRPRWRRRASAGLVAAGVAVMGAGSAGIVTAHAADDPGSGLGSMDIAVSATGLRAPFFSHSGEDVEGESPIAQVQMKSFGTSHALTSVFWPGDTGGHGGDTLKLLAGSCLPPNPSNTVPIPIPIPLPDLPCAAQQPNLGDDVYERLNDPYKAEAQSGTGDPTVTNSGQGVEMVATATTSKAMAATTMAGQKLPGLGDTFGATSTASSVTLKGAYTAVIDAVSSMRDIKLGGGVIKIAAVRSVAHATSDGKTASGNASTIVNGMKINGVPVTVDNKGIHVQGQGSDRPSMDQLNKVLKNAGFAIYVADPTKTIKGPAATLFSGQLIITQDQKDYVSSANDTKVVMSFGGAGINADTSRGYVFNGTPVPLPSSSPPPPVGSSGGGAPGVSVPPTTGGGDVPAPVVDDAPPPQQAPVLAAQKSGLPGGISPAWVVVVLLGAGLIAAGLKRLPDQVLAAGGPACTLGGKT